MKNYLMTLVFLIQATFLIKAQTPPIKWELVYDSVPAMGRHVEITSDKCYIVTASNNYLDGITMKIDAKGKIKWVKPYSGSCIKQTKDNGFIISNSMHAGLFKLNQFGDSIWFKSYGGKLQDDFSSVILTADNGFLACGFSRSFGDSSIFIVKTDSSGKLLWKRSLCSSVFAYANDLVEINNIYYVVGNVEDSSSHYRIVIEKLSTGGNLIWQKMYDVGFFANKIIHTDDDNILIAGGNIIMKLSLNGDTIWKKALNEVWRFSSIKQTSDQGFILAGSYSYDEDYGYQNNLIVKTDSAGEVKWSERYTTPTDNYIDNFESVQPTPDHGFIACGYSDYDDITKLRIIKADSFGNCITGFSTICMNKGYKIYPNPTPGKIIIDSKDIRKVEILDLNGSAIFSRESNVQEADISNLPKGIYFLVLTTFDGISIEKIIKE
jgi:hypothetical protein